jgi:stage III sporulation protein AA
MAKDGWKDQILHYLSRPLREVFSFFPEPPDGVEEIRIRAGRPLIVQTGAGELFPGVRGMVCGADSAYRVTEADVRDTLLLMTEHSLYARDEELRRGYLALPGGHRAGFAGRTVVENQAVKLLRDISGMNIRIAREIKGAGLTLLPHIYCTREKSARHTLIVSAPQAGKTTMLRDLARLLSDGDPKTGRPGLKVGIVDERSEIAGSYAGIPQLDVGLRSDVLDGCPKAEGMMMLIRSMSPQVVVTDELGRAEDFRALEEVINTGAAVLASVHGRSVAELATRPSMAYLFRNKLFERIVLLSRRKGPGTVESVISGDTLAQAARTGG